MGDLISRQAAIDHWRLIIDAMSTDSRYNIGFVDGLEFCISHLSTMPSVQPERLSDDDFETIRIHLNACKERLCNQHRWKEAEEYQRIIDRFMAFASAQPERKTGRWIYNSPVTMKCEQCGYVIKDWEWNKANYCAGCGADMRGKP